MSCSLTALHQLDSNYLVIKQWIPEGDQEVLFDHTRKIREKQNRSKASTSGTVLTRTVEKIADTEADPGKALDPQSLVHRNNSSTSL